MPPRRSNSSCRRGAPIVVKADGLAAGKGVTVALTTTQAEDAGYGRSSAQGPPKEAIRERSVVIEECLEGEEVSLFALCDGTEAILLGAAQDHKRLGDGDTGPNTGGMGADLPACGISTYGKGSEAAIDLFVRPALAEMVQAGACHSAACCSWV